METDSIEMKPKEADEQIPHQCLLCQGLTRYISLIYRHTTNDKKKNESAEDILNKVIKDLKRLLSMKSIQQILTNNRS